MPLSTVNACKYSAQFGVEKKRKQIIPLFVKHRIKERQIQLINNVEEGAAYIFFFYQRNQQKW